MDIQIILEESFRGEDEKARRAAFCELMDRYLRLMLEQELGEVGDPR